QQIEHALVRDVAYRCRQLRSEVACKRAELAQGSLLSARQQTIAPVDSGRHRLMPGRSSALRAGEKARVIGDPFFNLLKGENLDVARSEFDRQWKAIKAVADASDDRGVRSGQIEGGHSGARSFDEELDRSV